MVRDITTLRRNAATPRKIDGAKSPMLRFCSISLSTNWCDNWSRRSYDPEPAVRLEERSTRWMTSSTLAPRISLMRDVVEGAVHVEGERHSFFVHPEDAEMAVVGDDAPRLDLVDVLRREHDADDLQHSSGVR